MSNTPLARDPSGNPVEFAADAYGNLKQSPAGLSALGYQQLTSLASAAALTVPTGATVALIQAESQSIRWRDDGTNPTTSVGMVLAAGETVFFTGSLSAFRAIEVSASAKLNISYYG
jgi:hypothetical protein